jgi:hypothetical protein
MSTRVSYPGGKAAADHSPPSSGEVKNAWSYTSTPHYAFMAWFSFTKKHRNNFTFYLYEDQCSKRQWPHSSPFIKLGNIRVNYQTSYSNSQYIMSSIKFEVKIKLPLCFNWTPRHGGLLGTGGLAPRILDLGTLWSWVVSFLALLLYL